MASGVRAAVAPARGGRLTIGKVLAALRPEFPDISTSKIRFLEAEGLIEPERTAAGYRTYTQADLARLRYVLVAQRDRYWPLRVIREALDAIDRGLPDPAASPAARALAPTPVPDPEVPSPAELVAAPAGLSVTARELRDTVGLGMRTFTDLLDFGLLKPDDAGRFDEHDLAVAGAVSALSAYGLEPRHLRPFRAAADREIGLVGQLLASSREESRHDRAAEIVSACLRLHVALVKASLGR